MIKLLLILTLYFPRFVVLSPDNGLKSGRTNNPSGFIYITILSNIDKQFFRYNFKPQCLSYASLPETGYPHDKLVTRVIIPVKEFKCTNKSAYKDFLTLLKVEQYPFLEIDIPRNSNVNYDKENSVVFEDIAITVAGVSKQYDINCQVYKAGNENQILNGTLRVKLTDLGIVPPVKLFGILKVKNEIIIDFELCLKSASQVAIPGMVRP